MKAVSLFSSAGIGELLLSDSNIDVVLANEIQEKRVDCYKFLHPSVQMICGDIRNCDIKRSIIDTIKQKNIKLLIATPPCQGLSTIGKNKTQDHFIIDNRNYLIFDAFEIIDSSNFDYILIENVPRFLKMYFPYDGNLLLLEDIIERKYSEKYKISIEVLNSKNYGVPQNRNRSIIRLHKKHLQWPLPEIENEISLKDAIGHLPSLESGQKSNIKWHFAKEQNDRAVLALKHTSTGKSALFNPIYFPKKESGEKIKGFHNTFKRMKWDCPAPARTTYSGSISSHNNVHPGRPSENRTYSDARVLTLLETFIVHSVPNNIKFQKDLTDTFIRTMIGESMPPLMLYKILKNIKR
jgi:DNA (cytosine-5)-methyltransferase 1